jgi:hypothetical protein
MLFCQLLKCILVHFCHKTQNKTNDVIYLHRHFDRVRTLFCSVVDLGRIYIDPHQIERYRIRLRIQVISWIRIRMCFKVTSWIRIRINLQITSLIVWDTSLFEHVFKVLSLLDARIWIHSREKNYADPQYCSSVTVMFRD